MFITLTLLVHTYIVPLDSMHSAYRQEPSSEATEATRSTAHLTQSLSTGQNAPFPQQRAETLTALTAKTFEAINSIVPCLLQRQPATASRIRILRFGPASDVGAADGPYHRLAQISQTTGVTNGCDGWMVTGSQVRQITLSLTLVKQLHQRLQTRASRQCNFQT